MSVRPTPRFASVEDVDESSGDVIEETRKYAQSVASPSKERSNTSKPRKEGRRERRDSLSPPLTDSDSTAHPLPRRESRSKPPKDERSSSKRAVVTTRPQPKHSKTMPPASSYYGVPATVTTSTSRPRASTRPASYYATSRPPPANARWYSQQPAPPPPPSIPASYPAQPWTAPQALIYPGAQPVVQQDYFAARPLEHRFGRPNSAMGYRQPRPSYEEYEQENERPVVERVSRRSSLQKKMFKREEDARAMPPPQRPATTRPTSSAPFRPPPTTPVRRSLVFDSDDLSGHADLFQDISPQPAYGYGDAAIMRSRTRRPSIGAPGISYDAVPYQTEIARRPSRSGRRSSYLSGGYEDKLREATAYQNDVGTATIPLTEESLRKASKNSASSRSTRSSGSQDESDYRHSATTRTTRSSGEEDVTTIRAKGNIKFTIGDAEMRCEDGAEISFSSTRPGYRGGSDKSSYMDQDDRRTRYERPATRTRTSSQSGSYSRTMPTMPVSRYEAVYDHVYPPSPYEIPPYPAYPTHPTGSFF